MDVMDCNNLAVTFRTGDPLGGEDLRIGVEAAKGIQSDGSSSKTV